MNATVLRCGAQLTLKSVCKCGSFPFVIRDSYSQPAAHKNLAGKDTEGCPKLRRLNFSHNQLTAFRNKQSIIHSLTQGLVGDGLEGCLNLRRLHLSHNQLSAWPHTKPLIDSFTQGLVGGGLEGCPNLRRLHLSHNQLSAWPHIKPLIDCSHRDSWVVA